jgi:hypothetical protein
MSSSTSSFESMTGIQRNYVWLRILIDSLVWSHFHRETVGTMIRRMAAIEGAWGFIDGSRRVR